MRTPETPVPIVVVSRVLSATPDEVFSAWLDAEGMRDWFSPTGTATMTLDPRVGGAFRLVMSGQGMEIEHVGTYRVIDRPRELQFTWRSEFTGNRDTLVTIRLETLPDGRTDFVLTHELLSESEATSHGGGWGVILDRLQARLIREESDGC